MARDHEALFRFLAERTTMPFAWGRARNDCVAFVLEAIVAQIRRDMLPGVTWSSEAGAARVIARLGGLEHALDQRLRPIAPALAARGDVAGVADERFGLSVGVVEGLTIAGPGARGLKRLPRALAVRAWSIDG